MEHDIDSEHVRKLNIVQFGENECALFSAYIHHTLTPEQLKELTTLLEGLVLRAITTWAKL